MNSIFDIPEAIRSVKLGCNIAAAIATATYPFILNIFADEYASKNGKNVKTPSLIVFNTVYVVLSLTNKLVETNNASIAFINPAPANAGTIGLNIPAIVFNIFEIVLAFSFTSISSVLILFSLISPILSTNAL